MRKVQGVMIAVFILLNCCVDPYSIKSINYQGLLVVEGFISTDNIQHQVRLSRTSPINKREFIPETGASVILKFDYGSIPLFEESPGLYMTPVTKGVIGYSYTLLITTASGQQITSEKVMLRDTPDIKNVYATYSARVAALGNSAGFQIFLDAEDSTHQAHFYRWEYEETWQIQTPFESEFVWLGGNNVALRTQPVSTCYASDTSSNILLESTQGLSSDKITAQPIQTISGDAQTMRLKYSILVRQFTLTEEGFLYWQNLKKINETQGGLYDTQPGEITGNLTSVGSNETVLGYFDACVVKEKRMFFTPSSFSGSGFVPPDFESYCNFITPIQVFDYQIGNFLSQPQNSNLEITGATGFGPSILFLMPKDCCDCTSLGTNIKPSFWQ